MMNQLLKKKNELTKKKKGFTLVELIIVIAIIAVLAAVAIPKLNSVKKNSNVSADKANAKIIATAVSTAIANEEDDPTNPDTYKKYIDGGKVPAVKSVKNGVWTVSESEKDGITVKVNETLMYPPQ